VSLHVTDRLSAYLDGALDAGDLERVEAHLEVCGGCQRRYQELQSLQRLLRRLPEPSAAAGFDERLHWRLQRAAAAPSRREAIGRLWRGPLRVGLACATLLVVLGLPAGWMAGRLVIHEAPLDTDAYVREYLRLSVDRPLGDETATTFVFSDTSSPELPR